MIPATHAASVREAVAHAFVEQLHDDVEVRGTDGHHLAKVRRLRSGEVITLSDGVGTWRPYEVTASGSDGLGVRAIGAVVSEPRPSWPLTIAPALIAKNRYDDMVVALVELGVDVVIPYAATRCVVEWRGPKALAGVERLQRIAREAAMQCRRSWLADVRAVHTSAELGGLGGIVVANYDGVAVDAIGTPPASGFVVVTGPEGGLDPVDLDALAVSAPVTTLRLGANILRAETAPIAAAALFAATR